MYKNIVLLMIKYALVKDKGRILKLCKVLISLSGLSVMKSWHFFHGPKCRLHMFGQRQKSLFFHVR